PSRALTSAPSTGCLAPVSVPDCPAPLPALGLAPAQPSSCVSPAAAVRARAFHATARRTRARSSTVADADRAAAHRRVALGQRTPALLPATPHPGLRCAPPATCRAGHHARRSPPPSENSPPLWTRRQVLPPPAHGWLGSGSCPGCSAARSTRSWPPAPPA